MNQTIASSSSSNVNDTFFDGIYKDVWRQIIPPGLSEAECDFIQEIANLQKDDRVLDLMCGYGRHALELGRRGHVVTAIDNLAEYITEIREAAAKEVLNVEAIQSGALEVQLNGKYKVAICMGNSFAFFERKDAIALLKKLSANLEPDGRLLINSWMIAEIAIRHFRESYTHKAGEYEYTMNYTYGFFPSRIESEHLVTKEGGTTETIRGVDYIFTLEEMETLFNEAGFTTEALYGTPRKRPFKMGDGRIYIVATKNVSSEQ